MTAELLERAPALDAEEVAAIARLAGGRLDRAERLLDPEARQRRETLLDVARSVYAAEFDAGEAARMLLEGIRERGSAAKTEAEEAAEALELPARDADQRVRRAGRRAEREELLASLEELAWWYRDLIAVGAGAGDAVVHADKLERLAADASVERIPGAERACEHIRETWRGFEEFNLAPQLALEALFVRLRRELRGALAAA